MQMGSFVLEWRKQPLCANPWLCILIDLSIPGRGSCTSRPSTRWSVLSLKIRSNNSSSLMSECLRIVSLEIPEGSWRVKRLKMQTSICSFVTILYLHCIDAYEVCVFPYRHQLQLVSYSGHKSDWLGFLQREQHSDGVFGGQLKPISPRQPGPPPESAVQVSFLRWPLPPAWGLLSTDKDKVRGQKHTINELLLRQTKKDGLN